MEDFCLIGQNIMITVINFSHPLSDEAREFISRKYGWGDAVFHDVRVQIERSEPILPQVEQIAANAIGLAQGNAYNVDCIILPGLAEVAVLIVELFGHANIIRMSQVPNTLPPRFMPIELIHSRHERMNIAHTDEDEQ